MKTFSKPVGKPICLQEPTQSHCFLDHLDRRWTVNGPSKIHCCAINMEQAVALNAPFVSNGSKRISESSWPRLFRVMLTSHNSHRDHTKAMRPNEGGMSFISTERHVATFLFALPAVLNANDYIISLCPSWCWYQNMKSKQIKSLPKTHKHR